MKTKILILHASLGWGPKVTAENFVQMLSDKYEVKILTIEQIEKGLLTSAFDHAYTFTLEKLPGLWGFLYDADFLMKLILRLRMVAARFRYKKTLAILREFQPAIVISTSPVPSGLVAYIKSKGFYRGKLLIAFLDYQLHEFWLYKQADLYLCNIAEQVDWLKQLMVPQEKIAMIGAVVNQDFLKHISKEEACMQLRLLVTMPTILVTCGALIRRNMKEIFLRLLRSPKSFQVVVATGRNSKFKDELEKISPPSHHPVRILGQIDNMNMYMSASDVMVGKPGGRTMVETVIKKLPVVLTDIQPGHEMRNLEYILGHKIAVYGRIPAEVVFYVEKVLEGQKIDFTKAFEKIIKPRNSRELLEVVADLVPENQSLKVNTYR